MFSNARKSPAFLWLLLIAMGCISGCIQPRPELPGDSDYTVRSVEFEVDGHNGAEPRVGASGLDNKITIRVGNFLFKPNPYNPYRILEDRGRIEAWFQNEGHFDVVVDDPKTTFDHDARTVDIVWHIDEGQAYTVGSIDLQVFEPPPPAVAGLPSWDPDLSEELEGFIDYAAGDDVNMELHRRRRHPMEDLLREEGYGHAIVYCRTYVDKGTQQVHFVYFADPGPATYIGEIQVFGDNKVPSDMVVDRTGLEPGEPFSEPEARKATVDLVDTGAFANGQALTKADIPNRIRQRPPDTGGKMDAAQIGSDGRYVPRVLNPALPVELHVVDAPAVTVRAGGGGQVDISRIDALASLDLTFTNLFGPFHHLVFEGTVGYGHLWRDQSNEPLGVYGSAMLRYIQPSFIFRLLDLRITGRFDDVLYPSFHNREVGGAIGFRSTLLEHLFWDFDIWVRYAGADGYGPFDDATRAGLDLINAESWWVDSELQTSLIWDARNDPIEPTDGQYVAAGVGYAPGDPLGEHSYVRLFAEGRWFTPIWGSLSLGIRGLGGWLVGVGDTGAPPSARFWGGGTFGFRGFGDQQFSSYAAACTDNADGTQDCEDVAVGGLSTLWASFEVRYLPYRGQYGFVAFVDGGGVGDSGNPFDRGADIAVGAGVRLRIWYLPIAFDAAYRVLDDDRINGDAPDLGNFQFFFRIGEAF